MARRIDFGLGGVANKPGAVKAGRIVFVGASEMPLAVPNFGPGMIAAFVGRHGRAGAARGNADGATGINQNDGETSAGGATNRDRFFWALIRTFARGVVVNLHQFEDFFV